MHPAGSSLNHIHAVGSRGKAMRVDGGAGGARYLCRFNVAHPPASPCDQLSGATTLLLAVPFVSCVFFHYMLTAKARRRLDRNPLPRLYRLFFGFTNLYGA